MRYGLAAEALLSLDSYLVGRNYMPLNTNCGCPDRRPIREWNAKLTSLAFQFSLVVDSIKTNNLSMVAIQQRRGQNLLCECSKEKSGRILSSQTLQSAVP